jgi:HD superfamily phosphohydrolase
LSKCTKNSDTILEKIKIFNDPIYGFITIKNALIFNIIEHPLFQRLRRITQMGLSYLVYPGAHHTRFHHAIGCIYLMQKAIDTLRMKQVEISDKEEEGLYIAILLHDIGHGPFSHALEKIIIKNRNHEEISLRFMELLNREFDGRLELAIEIFKGNYHRKFMHQLISSQLDMDRLDYLKRDSFYSGVAEGNINSDRLISMLDVKNDQLLIDIKGIYSVEKFIVARRLMYWQVYLHKTSLAAEQILIKILHRAKALIKEGVSLDASKPLRYFLSSTAEVENLDDITLNMFSNLDDFDIISALKEWSNHNDLILSSLSSSIINRKLPKVKIKKRIFTDQYLTEISNDVAKSYQIDKEEVDYFVFKGKVENRAYNTEKERIKILYKNGKIADIVDASDDLSMSGLSNAVTKYFICYPKSY